VTRTIEEIQDALDAIVDPSPEAEVVDLTDEQIADVEALTAELETARARRERVAALAAKAREGRERATPALIVREGRKVSETIDQAFNAYLRTGQQNADIEELRAAQSEGTPSEGGYTVPPSFRQKLIDRMVAFGGIANEVETITTSDGRILPWVTIDDTSNSGEIVDEGGTFSGGADLVFGSNNLSAYSYMGGGASGNALRLPKELTQDTSFDLETLVSNKLGMRIARIQATHLVSGTGVSQPKGIKTGLTGTASIASTLVYKDFVGYIHAVDPAYRNPNCVWAMNDASLKVVRQLLDGSNRPLLKGVDDQALATDAGGDRLLGYRVVIDQGFPDIAANTTTNWGVFGDLKEGYVIRRVRDVELLVNPYSRMNNRQIEYSAWARMDATQQNTRAYTALTAHS
jgi:HK97 family phage major capsid protein